ncbi:MAG: zinc ribbon domain-containing protein [Coriobacteriia bacterium]|nr:zinc ribbon domain-containing protein [Coriobacteriia bacterium]
MTATGPQPQISQYVWQCPACGQPTLGPAFCDRCGAPLSLAPPVTPAQPRRPRRFLWLAVWALVLVLAGIGGFAFGFLTGPGAGPSVPTADQQAVIDEYGAPSAFVLADGPTGPGERSVRLEQWLYPDTGVVVYFVDGRRVAEDTLTFTSEFIRATSAPWGFDRAMRSGDVEAMLGEPGVELPGVETAFEEYRAYTYDQNRLVVGYLDGWMYTVQTY